jgi:murein DD-endopeptidase MepM/ murein hydrolase activator NlpD
MNRITAALALALVPAWAHAEPFYRPVGELVPGSGDGAADATVYAPGMRYPIQDAPSFPNSQVWGVGGSEGPAGSQCDEANFTYPWHDNYCETRSWDMPLCPSGTGHQGQDIRASSCDNLTHPYLSVLPGTVTSIGSYSVYVTADDGTRFDYLHGGNLVVSEGDVLAKGDPIGLVSNQFGGTSTTVHLHFNIKQDVAGVGFVFVSPYMSLVAAYEELTGLGNEPPTGPVDAVDCESIRGWAQDPDTPDQPVQVQVWFGGPADAPEATGVTIVADQHRDDLCDALGSCEHGFELEIPRSLRDEQSHPAFVYALDSEGGSLQPLDASTTEFSCAPPPVPEGVRRAIAGPEAQAAWGFSPFWELARIDAELHAAEPDRARAMQRLWRFVEEEAALGDEVALGRQALPLGAGEPELCEVLRIGMAVAYARSPSGALAWSVREGDRWSWQPLPDARASAVVTALFDAFAEHRGFGPATLLLPAVTEAAP